eukprot:417148_1
MECFKDFFDKLDKTEPKMIKKSKQVLIKRSAIQTRIHRLVTDLDKAINIHKQIEEETERINEEKDRINNGEEFHSWIDETSVNKTKCNKQIISCENHMYNECEHNGKTIEIKTIHLSGRIIEAMEQKK